MRALTYLSLLATACFAVARSPAHVGKSLPKPVSKLASRTSGEFAHLDQHQKRQSNSSYLNPTTESIYPVPPAQLQISNNVRVCGQWIWDPGCRF